MIAVPVHKTRSWSPGRRVGHCDPNLSGPDERLSRARDGDRVDGGRSLGWAPRGGVNDLDNESKVPLLSEMTRTQKIFEDKKAKREQRRSLRESGDFLGVQGANPRTGYWDVSSGTGSSEPSQMSEETMKKLEEEAKNIEEQKQKYDEAKAKHEAELVRVQALRDSKKKEKEKRKKMELKVKQRRYGRWKLGEEGWHSLAEPELSPIIQSVAESPGKGEIYSLAIWVQS